MQNNPFHFLHEGGECGDLIRSVNWSQTSLGNPEDWPQCLHITLSIAVSSRFPMFIFWGPELVCFYNDAYRPSLGNNGKHPAAIGRPGHEVWPEIWSFIKPLIDDVINTGTGIRHEDQLVPIYRNGKMEDVYWTYSYSAIRNDRHHIMGVLVVCTETTDAIVSRKKLLDTQLWLQLAVDGGELGIWDVDMITNTLHTSVITRRLYGLPENEEMDVAVATGMIHEKDRQRVLEAKNVTNEKGSPYQVTYTIILPDGTERILESKGKLQMKENGEPVRFTGTLQDVTAEVSARYRQQQLASLIENSSDFMAMSDLNGRMIYLNEAGRNLVGIQPDAVITGYSTKDFYSASDFEKLVNEVRPALANGNKWNGVVQMQHFTTGEEIICQAGVVNIYDELTGQPIARGVNVKDLRQVLSSQKVVKETGERLSLALRASNMGTYDWQIPMNQIVWDERCRELFGITDERGITYSQTFLNGLHPDDRQHTEEDVQKALDPGGDHSFASQYRTVDEHGKFLYWVKATGKCFFDTAGQPLRLVGTVLDVTENVAAQQQIAEREARFRMLADTMTQMVWIADAAETVNYANKSSYKYTGLGKETLNLESWQSLIHPDDLAAYQELLQQAFATGEVMHHEHRIRKHTGDYCWHLTRMTAHKDEMDQVQLWVSTSTDIHLLKEQEEKKNDFFQMASHELKTPVTSLKAYTQYLHRRFKLAGDEAAASFHAKMEIQIGRLEVLISDLLDINKIEGGQMRFNETVFAFNELAAEITAEIQHTTSRQMLLHQTGEPTVFGDRFRIGQVLTNLLSNAIKYSPGADRVEIKTYISAENVICCVSDFGIGIPEEQQANVFKRYYRVSGRNTDTYPGLGLGLYISAEIVKRQKGKIWLTSTLGKGSDFCFSLPLYNP